MRESYKLTKEECEMLGLDYEPDEEVKEEFDYLEQLKAKYNEQEIYNSLMEEDIDNEISNIKHLGVTTIETKTSQTETEVTSLAGETTTIETKDMLAKLREAKAHKDFADEDNQLENWEEKHKNQEEETLYF